MPHVRRMKLSHTDSDAHVHKNRKISVVNANTIEIVHSSLVGIKVCTIVLIYSASLFYLCEYEYISVAQACAITISVEIWIVLVQLAEKVVCVRRRLIIVSISPAKTKVCIVRSSVLAGVLVWMTVILVIFAKIRPRKSRFIRQLLKPLHTVFCYFLLSLSLLLSPWISWSTASESIQLGTNSSIFDKRNKKEGGSQRLNEWLTFMFQQRIHSQIH